MTSLRAGSRASSRFGDTPGILGELLLARELADVLNIPAYDVND